MAGSKDAACPSGTGAIVRCPWITSSPIRIGMPSRVFSTASRCSAFEADRGLRPEHRSDSLAHEGGGVVQVRTEDDLQLAELLGGGHLRED